MEKKTEDQIARVLTERLNKNAKKPFELGTIKRILDEYQDVLAENLKVPGDEVNIQPLGKLSVVERKERRGTNFQTGERITIPAYNALVLKPSSTHKALINP